jgi:hypothetical protein
MKRIWITSLVLSGILTLTTLGQRSTPPASNTAQAWLGAAIHQEAEGNLEAAIASYKKLLSQLRARRTGGVFHGSAVNTFAGA